MALRTPLSVTPHLYMGDSTGRPLDKGVVYFGEQDKDPEFYPINLFSDDALTKPLAQPVHTKGGYLYDKGDMVEPHAKELVYSVKVLDSYGRKVFYKGAMMRNSWNDDVIEQINTAIIGSADAARQVAIDITNDAINNTAIEGGVLADTFVVVDGSLSQRTINKGLESIADLSTIKNPKDGLRVYVKSYHTGLGKGGGYFVYNSSKADVNDGCTVINGWTRENNQYTATMFGAIGDGVTDDSQALSKADDYGKQNSVKVGLDDGLVFKADNTNINTANYSGNGGLKFGAHDRIMQPLFRKTMTANGVGIVTLEDEFGAHTAGFDNSYTAFSGSCLMAGVEYIVARSGKNHYYDAATPSSLVLYTINRVSAKKEVSKQVLYTSSNGSDVRDVNVSPLKGYGNRLLIKYVLQTSSNKTDAYLIVYHAADKKTESTRKLDFGGDNQYVWGNTLQTPSGKLLTASYGWDGAVRLYRSTAKYEYNGTGEIALELIKEFETSGHAEPTIGYWDDKLVIFYRAGKGINGKFAYTYNKEGDSGWSDNKSLTREVHAPYVECYNNKPELFMMCSLGTARSVVATFATQNLSYWYSTANTLVAGDTELASGQSGGYPSFVDYGDTVSMVTYADFRRKDGKLVSRLEARSIPKIAFSSDNAEQAQREVYTNSNLDWGSYSLGTGAPQVSIDIALKRPLNLKKVTMRMDGASLNTQLEIVDKSGSVLATSNKPSISAATGSHQDVVFSFGSTSLKEGEYKLRLQRADSANPLVFDWSTQGVRHRIIKNRLIDILNLTSSYNQTMWDNVGIHVEIG